jgi:hypothetical protein
MLPDVPITTPFHGVRPGLPRTSARGRQPRLTKRSKTGDETHCLQDCENLDWRTMLVLLALNSRVLIQASGYPCCTAHHAVGGPIHYMDPLTMALRSSAETLGASAPQSRVFSCARHTP